MLDRLLQTIEDYLSEVIKKSIIGIGMIVLAIVYYTIEVKPTTEEAVEFANMSIPVIAQSVIGAGFAFVVVGWLSTPLDFGNDRKNEQHIADLHQKVCSMETKIDKLYAALVEAKGLSDEHTEVKNPIIDAFETIDDLSDSLDQADDSNIDSINLDIQESDLIIDNGKDSEFLSR